MDGAVYHGISNVGIKPTVSNEQRLLVESFLFGYEGDAYGKFLKYHRPEQKFPDVESLKVQVDRDIAAGQEYFKV